MLLGNSVGTDQTARLCKMIWGYIGSKCDKGQFLINLLIYNDAFKTCLNAVFTYCYEVNLLKPYRYDISVWSVFDIHLWLKKKKWDINAGFEFIFFALHPDSNNFLSHNLRVFLWYYCAENIYGNLTIRSHDKIHSLNFSTYAKVNLHWVLTRCKSKTFCTWSNFTYVSKLVHMTNFAHLSNVAYTQMITHVCK